MATLEEVVRIVGVLKLAYPNFGARLSEDEWVALPRVWHRLLRDVPFDLLDAAAMHYVASSGSAFPPSIAELREAAYKLVSMDKLSAEEAWGEVQKAIRRFGSYRMPKFNSSIIGCAVEIIGWRALCASENEVADRAHFFRVYESLARRERNVAMMLPEVRETVLRLRAVDDGMLYIDKPSAEGVKS